jgi:two-component system phosphate regulon sensor histidine kinase PhoR
LADNLNLMAEQLEEFVQKLQTEKIELQRIISLLKEGLVVIDKQDRIKLYNKSFRKIVDTDNIEGRLYWEVIRKAEFIENLKKARQEETFFRFEIEWQNKVYHCSISFIPQNQNTIAVFHDISEIKKLAQMKKDFVSNVAHELRTPLTTIFGFLETLEEEETNEEKKHYLDIIKRNTQRLIQLVEDLLTLSELEEQNFKLNLENVNLKKLLNDLLVVFIPKIKDK